jgi:hypothetical protein
MKFKRKSKKPVIEKTITVLDSDGNIEETYDLLDPEDEVVEIKLEDEENLGLNDQEMKDLAFVTALRKDYNDVKDFESFVKDACASKKKTLSDEETLTDEEKKAQEEAKQKLQNLVDNDGNATKEAKEKLEAEKKALEDEQKLQDEIAEAERKKHESARKL